MGVGGWGMGLGVGGWATGRRGDGATGRRGDGATKEGYEAKFYGGALRGGGHEGGM